MQMKLAKYFNPLSDWTVSISSAADLHILNRASYKIGMGPDQQILFYCFFLFNK
jgi:hypothetical protein